MSAVMSMTTESEPTLRNGVPEYVVLRVERWANETKSNPVGAWPSVSILGRMIEHGPGAGAEGPQVLISDESAEIDHIVAKMQPKGRKVIEKEFKTWQSQADKAKQCHMSLSTYKTEVRCALWYIYGRLQS